MNANFIIEKSLWYVLTKLGQIEYDIIIQNKELQSHDNFIVSQSHPNLQLLFILSIINIIICLNLLLYSTANYINAGIGNDYSEKCLCYSSHSRKIYNHCHIKQKTPSDDYISLLGPLPPEPHPIAVDLFSVTYFLNFRCYCLHMQIISCMSEYHFSLCFL